MKLGPCIGQGRTAKVYTYGEDRVIKLFNEEVSETFIDYEFKIACIASEQSDHAPRVYEKTNLNGQIGIVYEQLKGLDLKDLLLKKRWSPMKVGEGFLACMEAIHRVEAQDLMEQFAYFERKILLTQALTTGEKEKILTYLRGLPEGKSLCHGDLHPENIIYHNKRFVAIDWTNAYSGNPASDIARTRIMLTTPYYWKLFSPILAPFVFLINRLILNRLMRDQRSVVDAWDLPVWAARLHEGVPCEEKWLLKKIRKRLYHVK